MNIMVFRGVKGEAFSLAPWSIAGIYADAQQEEMKVATVILITGAELRVKGSALDLTAAWRNELQALAMQVAYHFAQQYVQATRYS